MCAVVELRIAHVRDALHVVRPDDEVLPIEGIGDNVKGRRNESEKESLCKMSKDLSPSSFPPKCIPGKLRSPRCPVDLLLFLLCSCWILISLTDCQSLISIVRNIFHGGSRATVASETSVDKTAVDMTAIDRAAIGGTTVDRARM